MTNTILNTIDLTIGYSLRKNDPKIISSGLNLQLQAGEMVCLLGPNGAGKSTLMRTLAGLQPAISGDILINQTALKKLDASNLARNLSLILTDRIEVGNLTVREVVNLGRIPYTDWLGRLTKFDHEKVDWALDATETSVFQNFKITNLSDGERQKVMVARALAQDTSIIFLDEPTAHLDLPSRVEMMRLLHHLARTMQKAILMSTHELDLALQAADKLWLMKGDGTIKTGTPEDLVLNGNFEAAFSKSGFYFDKETGGFTIHQQPTQCNILVEGPDTALFWLKRALLREGYSTQPPYNPELKIKVDKEMEGFYYTLKTRELTSVHQTVQSLISAIKEVII